MLNYYHYEIGRKIKKKYLYSNKLNFFKLIFYFAHYIKSIIYRKIIFSNWSIDLAIDFFLKIKKRYLY
jgi:hypothetical protein